MTISPLHLWQQPRTGLEMAYEGMNEPHAKFPGCLTPHFLLGLPSPVRGGQTGPLSPDDIGIDQRWVLMVLGQRAAPTFIFLG